MKRLSGAFKRVLLHTEHCGKGAVSMMTSLSTDLVAASEEIFSQTQYKQLLLEEHGAPLRFKITDWELR